MPAPTSPVLATRPQSPDPLRLIRFASPNRRSIEPAHRAAPCHSRPSKRRAPPRSQRTCGTTRSPKQRPRHRQPPWAASRALTRSSRQAGQTHCFPNTSVDRPSPRTCAPCQPLEASLGNTKAAHQVQAAPVSPRPPLPATANRRPAMAFLVPATTGPGPSSALAPSTAVNSNLAVHPPIAPSRPPQTSLQQMRPKAQKNDGASNTRRPAQTFVTFALLLSKQRPTDLDDRRAKKFSGRARASGIDAKAAM